MSDQTSLEERGTSATPASPEVSKGTRSRSRSRRGARPEAVSLGIESQAEVSPAHGTPTATLAPEVPAARPVAVASEVAPTSVVSSVRRRRPRSSVVDVEPGEPRVAPPNGTAELHAAPPVAIVEAPVATLTETAPVHTPVAPQPSQLRRRPVSWSPPARVTPIASRRAPVVNVTELPPPTPIGQAGAPVRTPAQPARRADEQRVERNIRPSEAQPAVVVAPEHRNGNQAVSPPSAPSAPTTRPLPAPRGVTPPPVSDQGSTAIHYREDENAAVVVPPGPDGAVIYHVGQATQLQGDPESRGGSRRGRGRDRFGGQTPAPRQLNVAQSAAIGAIEPQDGLDTRVHTRQPEAEPVQGPSGELGLLLRGMEEIQSRQTEKIIAAIGQSSGNGQRSVTTNTHAMERVAVFVDVANLLYAARYLNRWIDFGRLLDRLVDGRRLVRAQAYSPTDPDPSADQSFFTPVKAQGYRVTTKNYRTFSSGAKKADMDLDMCMDIVRIVNAGAVDCVVLASGDGDFLPLLEYCYDHGVRVEIAAFNESTHEELKSACDRFINLTAMDATPARR